MEGEGGTGEGYSRSWWLGGRRRGNQLLQFKRNNLPLIQTGYKTLKTHTYTYTLAVWGSMSHVHDVVCAMMHADPGGLWWGGGRWRGRQRRRGAGKVSIQCCLQLRIQISIVLHLLFLLEIRSQLQ